MTYREFLKGEYLRTIPSYPNYSITNKGRVYSKYKKRFMKSNYVVSLWVNKKHKYANPVKLLLEAFPDVDFTTDDLRNYSGRKLKERGAYKFPIGKKNWRSMISVEKKKITLGYFKTKEEALNKYKEAYLMIRGFRAW